MAKIDWEKNNRNTFAEKVQHDYGQNMKRVHKITNKMARIEAHRKKKQVNYMVSRINWVKDTPLSLAIAFCEWRDAKQR